jgi:hypothetical protein
MSLTASTHQAVPPRTQRSSCPHTPTCPPAEACDREAARVAADHCEQGWRLLCNGVISFDDGGELLPDGHAIPAQHPDWAVNHAA